MEALLGPDAPVAPPFGTAGAAARQDAPLARLSARAPELKDPQPELKDPQPELKDPERPEVEAPEPPPAPDLPPGRGPWPGLVRRGLAFGREHVAVVAIIALAGCLWAGYSMTQARTVPVTVVSPTAAPQATIIPSATPAAVLVHVLGAVRRPGVVRLTPGARVQDAIDAAGGCLDTARPGDLNLAAVVTDGSQLVIGTAARPGGEVRGTTDAAGTTGGGAASGLVNLNTATLGQLDTLPGVGPVTAQAILDWRSKHQRFSRVEELQEVDGIGAKTFAQLAPKVTV